jgi:hypothetical protein
VLEKVGKTRLALDLVARTDLIVDVDICLRRAAINMDEHCQAVVEHMFFIGYINARKVLGESQCGQHGQGDKGRD